MCSGVKSCDGSITLGGEEGVKAVQFILGRWVEAAGMCLREGDNVATGNPRSSAETVRVYQSAAVGALPTGELSFSMLSHVC